MAFRLFWHIFLPPFTSSSDGLRSTQYAVGHTRFRPNSPEFQRRQTRPLPILRFAAPGTTAQNLLSPLKSRERDRLTVSLSLLISIIISVAVLLFGQFPSVLISHLSLEYFTDASESSVSAKPSRFLGQTVSLIRVNCARPVFWSFDLSAGSGGTKAMTKSGRGLRQTNRCDFREDVLVTLSIVSRTTSDKSRRFSDDTQSNVPVSAVNPSLHQSITDRTTVKRPRVAADSLQKRQNRFQRRARVRQTKRVTTRSAYRPKTAGRVRVKRQKRGNSTQNMLNVLCRTAISGRPCPDRL